MNPKRLTVRDQRVESDGRRNVFSKDESYESPEIPDHTLLSRISGGSYGEVWLARSALGSYCAVKIVFRSNFEEAAPYEREFEGVRKFAAISRSHVGLVNILQAGCNEEQGYFYYAMELADNLASSSPMGADRPTESTSLYQPHTLRQELRIRKRLSARETVGFGIALCSALHHLHQNGLVHRDVKPSNIIVVQGVPKLADIGLVTEYRDAKSLVGTVGYIPPEGQGSPQADIYSLGKVLYEASTGKQRNDFPEPPTDLGLREDQLDLLELNAVIHKACEIDAANRYRSAEEMGNDLFLIAAGKSVHKARSRRHWWRKVLWIVVTATALLSPTKDRPENGSGRSHVLMAGHI